jgi:glycosyltransferase involved in cell wall biosynthesis
MRIAYIVPYVPNLIRTRPYNLITNLSALGHEVSVFTLGCSAQERNEAEQLRDGCTQVHYYHQPTWRSFANSAVTLLSDQPLQSVYSWQTGMSRDIEQRIARNEFDVIHVEHLRGSRYGSALKARFPDMPVVWDSVDCISHLFEQASKQSSGFFGRSVTRLELPRTRRAEGRLVSMFEHVLVTSPSDKEALTALSSSGRNSAPISILPNGVDLDYFHYNPEVDRDATTIVFSGKMSYHANVAMVKHLVGEIMPRVWNTRPAVRLYIVGKDPGLDIKQLEQDPRITVTGTVQDIRPFLWRATLSVVPLLYGAGIQNKILEAMATGTPVVTSDKALQALQVQAGRDILVADGAESFARTILQLIDDRELQKRIGKAGMAYVGTHHRWRQIAFQLTNIYLQALSSNGPESPGPSGERKWN